MNGLSVLMFIFSFLILLAGIYIYTGHRSELLLWRTYHVDRLTINELRNIGKWTMITSIIPLIVGIIGFFIEV